MPNKWQNKNCASHQGRHLKRTTHECHEEEDVVDDKSAEGEHPTEISNLLAADNDGEKAGGDFFLNLVWPSSSESFPFRLQHIFEQSIEQIQVLFAFLRKCKA
jgi:hypothetical protein